MLKSVQETVTLINISMQIYSVLAANLPSKQGLWLEPLFSAKFPRCETRVGRKLIKFPVIYFEKLNRDWVKNKWIRYVDTRTKQNKLRAIILIDIDNGHFQLRQDRVLGFYICYAGVHQEQTAINWWNDWTPEGWPLP